MKLQTRIFYLYAVLVVVFICLIFFVPPSHADLVRYHLTAVRFRILGTMVAIPYCVIWLAGFFAYYKLKLYSNQIKDTKDGRHVYKISRGVLLLVLWPPFMSILGIIVEGVSMHHMHAMHALKVINGYFNLVWPLIGFIIISNGARGLSELVKARPSQRAINALAVLIIALGVLYGYLASYGYQHTPHAYDLPYWLVLSTLVAPYIYMWFIGGLSAYEIYMYHHKSAGVLYRQSWRWLALGIVGIIAIQVLVQYATTLDYQLAKLSLIWYLLSVYAMLTLLAAGYLLVAQGAKELQRIEEV
jgi:hypothetical protein